MWSNIFISASSIPWYNPFNFLNFCVGYCYHKQNKLCLHHQHTCWQLPLAGSLRNDRYAQTIISNHFQTMLLDCKEKQTEMTEFHSSWIKKNSSFWRCEMFILLHIASIFDSYCDISDQKFATRKKVVNTFNNSYRLLLKTTVHFTQPWKTIFVKSPYSNYALNDVVCKNICSHRELREKWVKSLHCLNVWV